MRFHQNKIFFKNFQKSVDKRKKKWYNNRAPLKRATLKAVQVIDPWKLNNEEIVQRSTRKRNQKIKQPKKSRQFLSKSKETAKIKLFNREFDPGSGWTLAACITHSSRTEIGGACSTYLSGGRVSNAWATCLSKRDTTGKLVLIPHNIYLSHVRYIKG